MASIIISFGIALCALIRKRSYLVTMLLFLLCFVMAWLTDDQYDYKYYELAYRQVGVAVLTRFEIGYVILMKIGNLFGIDYYAFRGIYSALSILLLFFSLRFITNEINVPIALGFVFPFFYLFPLQRTLAGVALVLFALRFLVGESKKDILLYFLFVILASLIHGVFFYFLIVPVYKLIQGKKNVIAYSIFILIILTALAQQGILDQIIKLFPLGDSIIKAISNGTRANFNGIIVYLISIILASGPVYLCYFYNPSKDKVIEMIFYFNIAFVFSLLFRVYSTGVARLLYMLLPVNYAAISKTLIELRKPIKQYSRKSFFLILIAALSFGLLIFLEFSVISPQLIDYVFQKHFTLNPVFQFINQILS